MTHRIGRLAAFCVFGWFALGAPGDGAEPPKAEAPAGVLTPPPASQFVVIPLRLHVLSATDLPEADCRLTDDDLKRILRKANGIWHQAGVHWGLEAVVREPAARQDRFRELKGEGGADRLGLFRFLIPDDSRRTDGLHVFYVHELPVNGVWMGSNFAIVKETAGLRKVEGGIDEPIPRVTAHELGHALGLNHRQDRTNLLASGTTGTSLNAEEVERSRGKARGIKGSLDVETLSKKAVEAEASGDRERAVRLWTWLSEIPGGDEHAKTPLERLRTAEPAKS